MDEDVFKILKEMRSMPPEVSNPDRTGFGINNPDPKLQLSFGHRLLFREYAFRLEHALKQIVNDNHDKCLEKC